MQADFTPLGQDYTMLKSMAISGTLNWRYLPYIGHKAYLREYPQKIWPKIWY
jgi:hypothetical protein